jgi:hypothetical protein
MYFPRLLSRNRKQAIVNGRGTVLLELTLSLSFLAALFIGTWQYGHSFYIDTELEQAVRAGARYAAQRTYDSPDATPSDAFLTAVQNVVIYGDPQPAAGAAEKVPGLSAGNVALKVTFRSGVPSNMAVSVSGYKLQAYFGVVSQDCKPVSVSVPVEKLSASF